MTIEELTNQAVTSNPQIVTDHLNGLISQAQSELSDAEANLSVAQSDAQNAVNAAQSRLQELQDLSSALNPAPAPIVDQSQEQHG